MSEGPVETKLAAARTRLVIDHPFLGALVLRLPLKATNGKWCRSTATDARSLYYNPTYIERLTVAQTQFMLAHEALHCALGHFARRGRRLRARWDLACDFAVNPLLVGDGLIPPPEAVVLEQFRGMSAEEIYPCLDDHPESETLDQHLYDGDEGGQQGEQPNAGAEPGAAQPSSVAAQPRSDAAGRRPQPLAAGEREALERKWRQHVAAATNQARQSGRLSAALARMVEQWLEPKLPWRALLARYLSQHARTDFSYLRPSRREGEMILPSLHQAHCQAVVALDVSGSIDEGELAEFVGEVNGIKGALPVRIALLACDAELAADAPWVCEPWDELRLPRRFPGGGGTRFGPVFEWVERAQQRPDVLIYFTDAQGEFPEAPPPYPVLWLVKGKAPVPWGVRIQMN